VTPELALAASAREWPDRLHRHILDHGGATVVTRVMVAEQAIDHSYDVMLIDDICSFLSPGLVGHVRKSGAEIVGVYAPADGSDAKRMLLECGISDVIETEAEPDEFLTVVASAMKHRSPVVPALPPASVLGWSIGVVGSTVGVGATEISIALAHGLSRTVETFLIDADPVWPSVSQRLGLKVHPNIRTALDATVHRSVDVRDSLQAFDGLDVLGGLADRWAPPSLAHSELEMLFEAMASETSALVVDLGSQEFAAAGVLRSFDSVAVVGRGDPVGVSRLLVAVEKMASKQPGLSLLLVVNQVPEQRFYQSEIKREVEGAFPNVPVLLVPADRRLSLASWDGGLAARGPFAKATKRIARIVAESLES